MPTPRILGILFTVVALLFSAAGCDKSPTGTDSLTPADSLASASKTQEAFTEMETQFSTASKLSLNSSNDLDLVSFARANTLYREALTANPNNPEANLGAAITEIFGAYYDQEIRNAVKNWEDYTPGQNSSLQLLRFNIPTGTKDMTVPTAALGRNLLKIIQTATTDPPTISQMQNLLRTKVLPRIDYALSRFATIEKYPNFEMRITGKMQGDANLTPVYLDLTEVYIMDAMVQGMKSMVEEFLVFQFNLASYRTAAIVEAIRQTNTIFFVLASDGATHSTNAKDAVLAMTGKIRSAINFLKAETDNQSDDIIKIHRNGQNGINESDLDTVVTYLTKVENTLKNTISFDITNWGTDKKNYTVQVNLAKFFDNPPQNPKANWLPVYTVDTTAHGDITVTWQAQTFDAFNFPDPTFGGIFPTMTNDDLKKILYIDEAFAWRLSCYFYDNHPATTYSNVSAKVVVNGKTYLPKPDSYQSSSSYYYYGDFDFFILDNGDKAAEVYLVVNGIDVKMALNRPLTVHLKDYEYLDANITLAPQNMTAQAYSLPPSVSLILQTSDPVVILRDSVGTGTFVAIDSTTSYTYSYSDYRVSKGKSYKYKIRLRPYSSYAYWYDYYGVRSENYSNTVSITVPN